MEQHWSSVTFVLFVLLCSRIVACADRALYLTKNLVHAGRVDLLVHFFCIVGKDDVSYITKNCKNDINDDVENTQCFISLQLAGGGSWECKCMTPL